MGFIVKELSSRRDFGSNLMGGVSFITVVRRNLLAVAGMAVVGLVLLMLAFLLPQGIIANNVKQSATIFEELGSYPAASMHCESQMDYFTDALILLEAANQHESSVLDRALTVYRFEGDPAPTLVEYAQGGASRSFSETGYARYWHGYLIYVKPLLCLFSFGMIRKVGVVLQALLLVCILWRLVKVRRPLVALGFWLGYVTVSVKAIGYCLQYWPATFGMLFTSLAIVLMWERKAVSLSRLSLLFTITGAAINYFDFLTYPLVTLVVPLLLLFALEGSSDPRRALSVFVVCALSWALAYALMWILKWLLATVLTGQNVFADAAAQAKYRSLASDSGEDVSYFQSLQRSLYRYANNTFNIAVAGFTVFSVVCLYLDARMNCEKLRLMARLAVPVILAIALVLLWYLGMLEHCWLHSVIVNRHFWTLGFGFSLGSASLLEALYHADPSRQGCEI